MSSLSDPLVQNAIAQVYEKLTTIPISAVLKHRRERRGGASYVPSLISVPEDARVGEIMLLLKNEGILALPVYRNIEGQDVGRQYTGIVSIYDILAFTVFQRLFDSAEGSSADVEKLKGVVEAMLEDQEQYFGTPIKELVGKSYESQESWSLNSSMPLSNLLQLFTSGLYHRALIIDDEALRAETGGQDDGPAPTCPPEGSFTTMLTQSDLLNFLADCKDIPAEAMTRILSVPSSEVDSLAARRNQEGSSSAANNQTALKKSRVVTVPDSSNALQAFRDMYVNRVSAVAVIDKEGGLAANLSASDLRGLSSSNLACLFDNVYTFLEIDTHRRADQVKADQLKFVEPDAPMHKAAAMMRDSRIHRVWIADDGDKPVGVVTLSDFLSVFAPHGKIAKEE
ncbi:hypothetical protein PhCBS80983_g04939 [Powellomyces hirtus]|uniref:CBS domain-containing protein n=1 Tax=Powellomyces hirtus TaxID=109895 RepID=A0A507DVW7_9FUNG|nr:hypothetical protein PhCBS80983_g04939 [Powellomyces hirtus]